MLNSAGTFQTFLSLLLQGALVASAILPRGTGNYQSNAAPDDSAAPPSPASDILKYISAGWDTLTRSMNQCESLEDTKTGESILYLPADMDVPPAVAEIAEEVPRPRGSPAEENHRTRTSRS